MRNFNKIMINILIFFLISLAFIPTTFAKTVSVDVLLLNIRSGPGTNYTIVDSLKESTQVKVIDELNDWYKIEIDSTRKGWVAAWLTSPVTAADSSSIDNSALLDHNDKQKDTKLISLAQANVSSLNIRSEANLNSSVISSIKPGKNYEVIQKENEWTLIDIGNNSQGWAFNSFLTYSQEEVTTDNNDDPPNTNLGLASNKSVIITADVLNIRSQATTDSDIIGKLSLGDMVTILEVSNNWYRIKHDSPSAWISAIYADELPDEIIDDQDENHQVDKLPYIDSDDNLSNTSNKPKVIMPIDGINIRQGPSTNHPVVHKAKKNDSFEIINSEEDWYEILLTDGSSAYVASWVVNVENIDSLDIYSKYTDLLEGVTIVIDPGHGGIDSGAIGSSFKTLEKDIILSTSLLLEEKLKTAGANVIMTRNTDVFLSLAQRTDISSKHQADAFISIHYNTNPNKLMNGTIVYYNNENGPDALLAKTLQRSIVETTSLNNMGARYGNYYVLRENSQLAVLVEAAFISNYDNELLSRSKQFQDKVAEGIFQGLIKYFKEYN